MAYLFTDGLRITEERAPRSLPSASTSTLPATGGSRAGGGNRIRHRRRSRSKSPSSQSDSEGPRPKRRRQGTALFSQPRASGARSNHSIANMLRAAEATSTQGAATSSSIQSAPLPAPVSSHPTPALLALAGPVAAPAAGLVAGQFAAPGGVFSNIIPGHNYATPSGRGHFIYGFDLAPNVRAVTHFAAPNHTNPALPVGFPKQRYTPTLHRYIFHCVDFALQVLRRKLTLGDFNAITESMNRRFQGTSPDNEQFYERGNNPVNSFVVKQRISEYNALLQRYNI